MPRQNKPLVVWADRNNEQVTQTYTWARRINHLDAQLNPLEGLQRTSVAWPYAFRDLDQYCSKMYRFELHIAVMHLDMRLEEELGNELRR